METYHILVVEDDPDINKLLCRILEGAGYQCRPAFSGSEAELWAAQYDYDLILLDLMLPGLSGEEFIAKVRQGKTMPIIVASAKAGLEDRVNVLKLGADDFIPKPYSSRVLIARIQALLRRVSGASDRNVLEHKGLTLDLSRSVADSDGRQVELTKNEMRILALLMSRAGTIVSREAIMRDLWDSEAFVDDNTLTVNINRLRSTLEKIGVTGYLTTHRGRGYSV